MTVHFVTARRVSPAVPGGVEPMAVCGRRYVNTSEQFMEVTCLSCMNSTAYRRVNRRAIPPEHPAFAWSRNH